MTETTDHERSEALYKVTIDLLWLLHAAGDLRQLARDVTALMQDWSGCEAVGIRLREGHDYPYFEARGFPAAFVEAERSLCQRGPTGAPVCDEMGNPVLECMCGDVILGRFDPTSPCFTTQGSFWTNSTSDLFSRATKAEPPTLIRHRCNAEGYESMALIPLRLQGKTLGLLQFNDHRKNLFSAERIQLFERMANCLAIGLSLRQAVGRLQESEERYRRLFEMESDSLVLVDNETGQVLEVNAAATALYGYSHDEWLGMEHTAVSAEPDKARKAILDGKAQILLGWHRKKDGSVFPVEIAASHFTWCDRPTHLAAIRDISQRLLSEKILRESQALLQSTLDALLDSIAILDEAGVILAVNASWRKFADENDLGWPDYGVGRNYLRVCDIAVGDGSQEARTAARYIREVLAGQRPSAYLEYPCHSPSENRWFVMRVTRFQANGSARVVLAHDNVTEQKEAEALLQQRQTELAHISRLNMMGELASGLAHELNQPLATILSGTEALAHMLQSETPDSSDTFTTLKEIGDQAERAGKIISRMRRLVSKRPPQLSTLNVEELVRDALALLEPDLRSGQVTVRLELQKSLPTIQADIVQIQQVLVNLIRNGCEAMSDLEPNRRVLAIQASVSGSSKIEITVRDQGTGLSPQAIDRVFEPFFTTKPQGIGIGLSISRSIIESHGGRLWITPNSGPGVTFRFSLPLPRGVSDGD